MVNLSQTLANPVFLETIHTYREDTKAGKPPPDSFPKELAPYVESTQALVKDIRRPVERSIYRKSHVPGWILGIDATARNGITNLTHGFLAFGHIGEEVPVYFSKSSDEKRGGFPVDEAFIKTVQAKKAKDGKSPFFSGHVISALKNVEQKKYPSKEAFFFAYTAQREQGSDLATLKEVINEYIQLTFFGHERDMEVWIRDPKGRDAPKGKEGLAERDVRTFADPWYITKKDTPDIIAEKTMFNSLTRHSKAAGTMKQAGDLGFRYLPDADLLGMHDAKRAEILERSYVDALHNRNGTLIPSSLINYLDETDLDRPVRHLNLQALRHFQQSESIEGRTEPESIIRPAPGSVFADLDTRIAGAIQNKETYEFAPAGDEVDGINCNTGARKYLLESGVSEPAILPSTPFQIGLHAKTKIRNLHLLGTPDTGKESDHASIRDIEKTRASFELKFQTSQVIRKAENFFAWMEKNRNITRTGVSPEAAAAASRLVANPNLSLRDIIKERQSDQHSQSSASDAELQPVKAMAKIVIDKQWEGHSDSGDTNYSE